MSLNRRVLLVPLCVMCGFMLAVIMGVTPFSKAAPAPAAQAQVGRYQLVSDKTGLILLETDIGKIWIKSPKGAGKDLDTSFEWRSMASLPPN
jgi:hypothetical protein